MKKITLYRLIPAYMHITKPGTIWLSFDKLCKDLSPYDMETAIADDNLKIGFTILDMQENKPANSMQKFYYNYNEAASAFALLNARLNKNSQNEVELIKQTITPAEWQNIINDVRRKVNDSPILDPAHIKIYPKASNQNLQLYIQLKDNYGEVHLEKCIKSEYKPHPLQFRKAAYDSLAYFEKSIDDTLPEVIQLTTNDNEI